MKKIQQEIPNMSSKNKLNNISVIKDIDNKKEIVSFKNGELVSTISNNIYYIIKVGKYFATVIPIMYDYSNIIKENDDILKVSGNMYLDINNIVVINNSSVKLNLGELRNGQRISKYIKVNKKIKKELIENNE